MRDILNDLARGALDREWNPMERARALARPALPKRIYDRVSIAEDAGLFVVRLDNHTARTPGGRPLGVPVKRIAEVLAQEWDAQKEEVDPATMPLTRLVNAAIDGVAAETKRVITAIAAYARNDLLCYRADGPEGLLARQAEHWDPVLSYYEKKLHKRIRLAVGVMHVEQDPGLVEAIEARLSSLGALSLTAAYTLTNLTGSVFLALAVIDGVMTPDAAWTAAHVDEDWQMSHWGEDAEAMARRARRRAEFDAAALVVAHLH